MPCVNDKHLNVIPTSFSVACEDTIPLIIAEDYHSRYYADFSINCKDAMLCLRHGHFIYTMPDFSSLPLIFLASFRTISIV